MIFARDKPVFKVKIHPGYPPVWELSNVMEALEIPLGQGMANESSGADRGLNQLWDHPE